MYEAILYSSVVMGCSLKIIMTTVNGKMKYARASGLCRYERGKCESAYAIIAAIGTCTRSAQGTIICEWRVFSGRGCNNTDLNEMHVL
jgi:hypothetical protein